jgi:hypothetical protein
MKPQKFIAMMFTSILILAQFLKGTDSIAQSKVNSKKKTDCCMMKDGKMMCITDGKLTTMEKTMTMKNGTKCMVNGECIMKDGQKIQIKEGEQIDMNGNIEKHFMSDNNKLNNAKEKGTTAIYTCPMHSDVTSDKEGKCPKCGMDLVKK